MVNGAKPRDEDAKAREFAEVVLLDLIDAVEGQQGQQRRVHQPPIRLHFGNHKEILGIGDQISKEEVFDAEGKEERVTESSSARRAHKGR